LLSFFIKTRDINFPVKKLTFSFLASASFIVPTVFASHAQALPVWATTIARAHCEYLAMGAGWDEAIGQALRDNSHWMSDLSAAGDLGTKAVVRSIQTICPALNERAFTLREKSRGTSI
jgi:hypothetical protein